MPELPEVETVRRGLRDRIVGARLVDVEVRERRLRRTVRVRNLERLSGRRIEDVRRRGKFLALPLEGGAGLIIHLGMSGQLLLLETGSPLARHDHVRWKLAGKGLLNGLELRFRDPRRFGLVVPTTRRPIEAHPLLVRLGPEPFDDTLSPAYLRRRAQRSKRPVKNMLMDARVVAGMGNIYASEALWLAQVNPRVASGRVSLERWRRIRDSMRNVLSAAIAQGGTTLNDFRGAFGELGYFRMRLNVYDREGDPCPRCENRIRRIVQAGRSTYYCTRCQH